MRVYLKIVALLIISFFPLNIYAYNLTCEGSSYQIGDTFSCSVNGMAATYDKLSGTLTSSEILSCKRTGISSGLEPDVTSNDTFFELTGTSSSDNLVTYSCQVLTNPTETTNATVSIEDFTYHIKDSGIDEKTEILRSDYIKIEPKKEELPNDDKPRDISNPSLRPKKLTAKELDITFSQFITEYSIEVLFEVEELNFEYELNDPTSSLRIEGDTKLQVGKNVIDIYVTSADGQSSACYTFTVERLARGEEIYYKESDSTLKSMVIPGFAIGFENNKFDYSIHLTRDISSININTVPNYEGAIVSVSKTDNLSNGDIIVVEVTSADETSKTTYRIKITKDAPKKDYSTVIIIVTLGIALIGTIIMFIKTSQKRKNDPLLSTKYSKRKINKGQKFDSNVVPNATDNNVETNLTTVENEEEQINSINLNNANIVSPIETEKVKPASFNQVSSTKTNVDLSTNLTPTPINNEQMNPNPEKIDGLNAGASNGIATPQNSYQVASQPTQNDNQINTSNLNN